MNNLRLLAYASSAEMFRVLQSYMFVPAEWHSGIAKKKRGIQERQFLETIWYVVMLPNVCSSNGRVMEHEPYVWIHRSSCFWMLLAYFGTELGIWQCVPTTLWIMKASTCQNYATIFGCVKQLAGMLLYLL